jgi:hypothetical protein
VRASRHDNAPAIKRGTMETGLERLDGGVAVVRIDRPRRATR